MADEIQLSLFSLVREINDPHKSHASVEALRKVFGDRVISRGASTNV